MSEGFNRVQTADMNNEDHGYFATDDQGRSGVGFQSQAAITAAMDDPRYKTDQHFRNAVIKAMRNTSPNVIDGHKPTYDGRSVEAMEVETDWVTQAMSRPEYKTSALFRRQVAEAMAGAKTTVKLQAMGSPEGCFRVNMDSGASVSPMAPGVQRVTVQGEADGSDD